MDIIAIPQSIISVTKISKSPTSGLTIISPNKPPLFVKTNSTSPIQDKKKTATLIIFNPPKELLNDFINKTDNKKDNAGSMKYPMPNKEEKNLNMTLPIMPALSNADSVKNTPMIKKSMVNIPLAVSFFKSSNIPDCLLRLFFLVFLFLFFKKLNI